MAEIATDDKWELKIEPLLCVPITNITHTNKPVIKQYYIAILEQKTNTFYIEPKSYKDIFNDKDNVNINENTFTHNFEFESRNIANMKRKRFIIKCAETESDYDWAIWKKKKLKMYTDSIGYWQILSQSDESFRVPINHLNAILSLMRHKSVNISNKHFSIVFLNEKQNKNEYKWTNNEISAEYQITFWNGSFLSVKIIKASNPIIDKKKKLKSINTHFLYYKSNKNEIEWLWYDNDAASWKEYSFSNDVPKQLEATYQAISENCSDNVMRKMFNCAQLPAMSNALQQKFNFRWKPFVLRFACKKEGNIINIHNIEQLAINSYYDQFPREIKRIKIDSFDMISASNILVFGYIHDFEKENKLFCAIIVSLINVIIQFYPRNKYRMYNVTHMCKDDILIDDKLDFKQDVTDDWTVASINASSSNDLGEVTGLKLDGKWIFNASVENKPDCMGIVKLQTNLIKPHGAFAE